MTITSTNRKGENAWEIPSLKTYLTSLKSTCDVNLLSKLSIIFKEWRVMNNVLL
jgi:hypothetical protein